MQRKEGLMLLMFLCAINFVKSQCPSDCKCRGPAIRCNPGLTAIPTGVDPTTIKHISLSGLPSKHNTIPRLDKRNLPAIPALFTLIITFSDVTTIEDGAFSGYPDLHNLDLSNNEFKKLTANTFTGLSHLRTLDLSGNTQLILERDVFKSVSTLEELDLGDVGISSFADVQLSTLVSLKVLKLYNNNIRKIAPANLQPFSKLETLDLTGNLLRELPNTIATSMNKLSALHLSDNPWHCHCQFIWAKTLNTKFLVSGTDGGEVLCHEPDELKYMPIVNVADDKFQCIPPKVVRCTQQKYDVEVNHGLQISCETEGDPIPDIKWQTPSGVQIVGLGSSTGQFSIDKNGTLTINSATAGDEGDWTITAFNASSSDSLNVNVHVTGITTTTTTTTTKSTTSTTTTPTTTTTTTKSTTTSTTTIKPTTTKANTNPVTTSAKNPFQTQKATSAKQTPGNQASSNLNPPVGGNTQSPIDGHTQKVTNSGNQPIASQSAINTNGPFQTKNPDQPDTMETKTKSNPKPGDGGAVAGHSTTAIPEAHDSPSSKPESTLNIGMLVAAAGGGGTLVGLLCLIYMCIHKKKKATKNKVRPFSADSDV